jgi:hypothetical protein
MFEIVSNKNTPLLSNSGGAFGFLFISISVYNLPLTLARGEGRVGEIKTIAHEKNKNGHSRMAFRFLLVFFPTA